MSINIGRNEECHCGSGKKYKKCCVAKDAEIANSTAAGAVDFAWYKLRKLEAVVIDQYLTPYVNRISKAISDDVMMIAAEDFFPDYLSESLDKEMLFNNFFHPWFLFNWVPGQELGISQEEFDPDQTIAENYLKLRANYLSFAEREFLEAMNQTYYSFYTILDVQKDKSVTIKDILLNKEHEIKERQGTHYLKRGDIVLGRIVTLGGQSIFIGMAPHIIPVAYGTTLIDFRKWLIEINDNKKLTSLVLRNELDFELIDYYFTIMNEAYDKPLPILRNTDGELIQFTKSYFKLTIGIEEAFKKLLPLTMSDDSNEFLQDAERDEAGKIKNIEFPWLKKGNKQNKSWDNTVLGHIILEKGRVILETNSYERSEKGKKLLLKYLSATVAFQKTLIEAPEQKLKSPYDDNAATDSDEAQTSEELLKLPEVQEKLKQMLQSQWEDWLDIPIPALNNTTPRAAAKTKTGIEMLEVLLLQYEYNNLEQKNDLLKVDIAYLRSELGLK